MRLLKIIKEFLQIRKQKRKGKIERKTDTEDGSRNSHIGMAVAAEWQVLQKRTQRIKERKYQKNNRNDSPLGHESSD